MGDFHWNSDNSPKECAQPTFDSSTPRFCACLQFLCGRHRFVNQKQEPIDRTCMWREQIILTSLIFTWEMYMTNHSYPLMHKYILPLRSCIILSSCGCPIVASSRFLPFLPASSFITALSLHKYGASTGGTAGRNGWEERLGGTACNMHVYTNSLSLSQPYR